MANQTKMDCINNWDLIHITWWQKLRMELECERNELYVMEEVGSLVHRHSEMLNVKAKPQSKGGLLV